MSVHEYEGTSRRQVRGAYIDAFIDNDYDALEEYLNSVRGSVRLWDSAESELLFPVRDVTIDYVGLSNDEMDLLATFEFDALTVNGQSSGRWQKNISGQLREKLTGNDVVVFRLPHQQNDFYAALGDEYAVHVQFTSGTHDCHVSLRLEDMAELFEASNGDIDGNEVRYESTNSRTDTLQDFVSLFTLAIDTVTAEYGELPGSGGGTIKPAIHITSPRPFENLPNGQDEEGDFTETANVISEDDESRGVPLIEMYTSPPEGLSSIGGLVHAKERLQTIANALKDPEGARMYGVKPSNFLLHGPAGTGKTSLVEAFAEEIGADLRKVKSTDLVEKWVGGSGKNVDSLFESVMTKATTGYLVVLFFDEFEAIARRGHGGTSERDDVKKQLNIAIDAIRKEYPNVIIAAATNADLDDLEPSLIRPGRFEKLPAPLPNVPERIDIWGAVLLRSILSFRGSQDIEEIGESISRRPVFVPYADDINIPQLAEVTDGMTGADFEEVLDRARQQRYQAYRQTGEKGLVDHIDLLREIRNFHR